jgi:hypothetical protein
MELPNRHLAYVPEAKIIHYLLNVNHPDGWGKAQEFRRRGYDELNVAVMGKTSSGLHGVSWHQVSYGHNTGLTMLYMA